MGRMSEMIPTYLFPDGTIMVFDVYKIQLTHYKLTYYGLEEINAKVYRNIQDVLEYLEKLKENAKVFEDDDIFDYAVKMFDAVKGYMPKRV